MPLCIDNFRVQELDVQILVDRVQCAYAMTTKGKLPRRSLRERGRESRRRRACEGDIILQFNGDLLADLQTQT